MPVYKNNTVSVINWDGDSFLPGEEKSFEYFLPYTALGLTLFPVHQFPHLHGLFVGLKPM